MTVTIGVLALIVDPVLRDDVDRVAAAAGVPVVHASEPSSRKVWGAAAAVLLDVPAALRCAEDVLPRRGHVVLVSSVAPGPVEYQAAISVGAQHVITLPAQDDDLVAELSRAVELAPDDAARGAVISVIAGRGGAGASVFAAALAQAAAEPLLVDVDPWSGGIDLVLGSESQRGLRWSDVTVQRGRLSYSALQEALPRHRGISVLSTGRGATEVDAGALAAVIDAGCRGGATVICDLPRRSTAAAETALAAADLAVLVSCADVRGCAAAAAIAPWVSATNPNVGLVVRGPAPGGLRPADVATSIGLPLLAAMRPQPGVVDALERHGLRVRSRSPLAVAARKVLAVLRQHPATEAA